MRLPGPGGAWKRDIVDRPANQLLLCFAAFCVGTLVLTMISARGGRCLHPNDLPTVVLATAATPALRPPGRAVLNTPETSGLIYDIGLNDGTDTAVYLKENYSVVAVDANPMMVAQAAGTFVDSLMSGRLRLLNVGLVDDARLVQRTGVLGPQMDFYVHQLHDDWSSFLKEWGCRPIGNETSVEKLCQVIQVPTTSCGVLVKRIGRAHFMKIDIEGYDMQCIQSVALLGRAYLPYYVSVEGPDAGKIDTFVRLGYTRFKIQSMKGVLNTFYKTNNVSAMGTGGGSGPWGEDAIDIEIGHAWRNRNEAIAALVQETGADGDWYDLHVAF